MTTREYKLEPQNDGAGESILGPQWADSGPPPPPPPPTRRQSVINWIMRLYGSQGSSGGGGTPPPPPPPPPPNPTSLSTTTPLSSPLSGTLPFTFGLALDDGQAMPNDIAVTGGSASYQVLCKTTFPSGYASIAQISGTYVSAGSPVTLSIANGASPTGTALDPSLIAAVPVNIQIGFGTYGSVDVATMLDGTPKWVPYAGHKSVHAEYSADVGAAGLEAGAFVHHYPSANRTRIVLIWRKDTLDNGAGGVPTRGFVSYVPSITIDGVVVWNNGGAAWDHSSNTEPFSYEYWIGGDPQVIAYPSPTQLIRSRKVPNMMRGAPPTEAVLASLYTTHVPNGDGWYSRAMGAAGAQPQIGVIPRWEPFYLHVQEPRTVRAILEGAKALRTFPTSWRSHATRRPIKISDFADWAWDGNGSGSYTTFLTVLSIGSGKGFEINHSPTGPWLAYLLTADPMYYSWLMETAATNYIMRGHQDGYGTGRVERDAERGFGWALRTKFHAAAAAFDTDPVGQDWKESVRQTFIWAKAKLDANTPGCAQPLGIIYLYPNDRAEAVSFEKGQISNFMLFYCGMAMAAGRHLKLFTGTDKANIETISNGYLRYAARFFGPMGDPREFGFSFYGQSYHAQIGLTPTGPWAQDGGDIMDLSYTGNFGANANAWPGENRLYDIGQGSTPDEAADGRFGEGLCVLAYGIDFGIQGAQAGLDRLMGCLDWSRIAGSYWFSHKHWSILPYPAVDDTPPPPPPPPPPPDPVDPSNVAAAANGGVATASTTYTSPTSVYPPLATINGVRTGAGWATASGGWNSGAPGVGEWLRVRFAAIKTINRVVVYSVQDSVATGGAGVEPSSTDTFTIAGLRGWLVQVWNGSIWTTVSTVSGNNLVKREVTFSAVDTTHVRILVTDALATYARIVELEVFGGASAAAPMPRPEDVYPTAVPAWRQSMAPLDVITFPGTEFHSAPGSFGGSAAVGWFSYSGAAIDQLRGRSILFGGGHADSSYNGGWLVEWMRSSGPGWSQYTYSSPRSSIGWVESDLGETHYHDTIPFPRASARHTYRAIGYDPTNDRLTLHACNATFGVGFGGGLDTDAIALRDGEFLPANTYLPMPVDPGFAGAFAQGPSGSMYHVNINQHLYRWTPSPGNGGAPGVITDMGAKGFATTYEMAHCVIPNREALIRFGVPSAGTASAAFHINDPLAPATAVTVVGDAYGVSFLTQYRHQLEYDPHLDCLWAWMTPDSSPELFRVNISGTQATGITLTVLPKVTLNGAISVQPPVQQGLSGYRRFGYIESLRGLGWIEHPTLPLRFIATSNFP